MTPLLEQFLSESTEFSQGIGEKLMQLEKAPNDHDAMDELFRLMHTLKGNSGLFTFPEMTRVLHAGEDLLVMVRSGEIAYSRRLADGLLAAMDFVMVLCGDIEKTESIDASRAEDSVHIALALFFPRRLGKDSQMERRTPRRRSLTRFPKRFGGIPFSCPRAGPTSIGLFTLLSPDASFRATTLFTARARRLICCGAAPGNARPFRRSL
jgi:HPt (histidine-containing phosphotransfer) domain-containing protein